MPQVNLFQEWFVISVLIFKIFSPIPKGQLFMRIQQTFRCIGLSCFCKYGLGSLGYPLQISKREIPSLCALAGAMEEFKRTGRKNCGSYWQRIFVDVVPWMMSWECNTFLFIRDA